MHVRSHPALCYYKHLSTTNVSYGFPHSAKNLPKFRGRRQPASLFVAGRG